MMRYEDWPQRLAAVIEAARKSKFSWREHNCALFAADVVTAITGRTFVAGRRQFSMYRAHGVRCIATEELGPPISTKYARRGDVVMHKASLGICLGANCAFTGETGLVFVKLSDCEAAWRV